MDVSSRVRDVSRESRCPATVMCALLPFFPFPAAVSAARQEAEGFQLRLFQLKKHSGVIRLRRKMASHPSSRSNHSASTLLRPSLRSDVCLISTHTLPPVPLLLFPRAYAIGAVARARDLAPPRGNGDSRQDNAKSTPLLSLSLCRNERDL